MTDRLAVTYQCKTCEGDGYYERWLEDAEGRDFPVSIPCDICGGTGELRAAMVELWKCGECEHVAPSREWGIVNDDPDTAVCPGCGFVHYDNENSFIDSCGFVADEGGAS